MKKNGISRREFLKNAGKAAGGVAAGGLLAGCATASGGGAAPVRWDYEADVVIAGYGGAGAVAAITAHDAGSRVLVLEKQAADTPAKINQLNSTRTAATAMMNFHSKAEAITYLTACSRGATPADVIESWAEYACKTYEWFESIGGTMRDSGDRTSEYSEDLLPAAYSYNLYMHAEQGPGFWRTLDAAVQQRGIQILFETPALRLITNAAGDVTGITALQGGREINVKAGKAVVLTTGGFEFDFELLDTYCFGTPCRFYANPGNTGDGLKMAQAIGAALWHMPLIGGRVIPYFPELGYGIPGGTPSPFILVDKYGKRFMRETWKSHSAVWESTKFNTDLGDFPSVPCFSVFDQSAVNKGPVVSEYIGQLKLGNYTWSRDNSEEIRKGWILKGNTIEELAAAIARDPEDAGKMKGEVLADTLRRYNGYCDAQNDAEFGRRGPSLQKLAQAPYYALKMYPGGVNTFGGPRRNAKSQIVRPDHKPIGRLYSAGELGSILGFLYAGGGWNFCELVVSGQIAGKHAAAETPWS